MPFSKWDLGSCCCGPTCTVNFTVYGCSGPISAGITVSVYSSSGGTLLGSGTTNASGVAAVAFTGSTGTYWVAVTGMSARFAAFGVSQSLTCGGSRNLQLVVATGFTCLDVGVGCNIPIPNTLFLTDSLIGAATLTFSAGAWRGSITYSYPGFNNVVCGCSCIASTVTVNYVFSTSAILSWTFAVSFATNCPDNVGTSAQRVTTALTLASSVTCPPSFDFTQDITLKSCALGCGNSLWSLYGGIVGAVEQITITE